MRLPEPQEAFVIALRLALSAQQKWRRLYGCQRLAPLIERVQRIDAIREVQRAVQVHRHHVLVITQG